jgi:hypothetical protein
MLALAALLPLSGGAANLPFFPFDIFDTSSRDVIIDKDFDDSDQVGLDRYSPKPGYVLDFATYPLIGYDLTNPSTYPFVEDNNPTSPTNLLNGSGLGEPFNPSPFSKVSRDEGLAGGGSQYVFGLDCDATTSPGCLLAPAVTSGGGDPLVTLGIDGAAVGGSWRPTPP